MYKNMFLSCMKEKFGRMFAAYYVLLGAVAVFIDETLSYGMLFSLVIFTAVQITRMFSLQSINCINNGYVNFRVHKPGYILSMAFLANIPWLLFMIIKTWMAGSDMVFLIIIIWAYAMMIGIILGLFVKSEVVNFAVILGCFFFCVQKMLIHELYFRYVSPVLIFKGDFNVFNIAGICILSIAGMITLFLTKKKARILVGCLIMICFTGLVFCEMQYESNIADKEYITVKEDTYSIEYNPVLDEERIEHIAKIIDKTEGCLKQYGFDFGTTVYRMDYTIYFPWESNQQKVFMMNNDGGCNINFYTESMYNISDDELITRYIYSTLQQSTQLQEIAVELLIDDVASQILYDKRTGMLDDFSYDNLMETYGYCASPKQCAVAECMKMDMTSFAAMYDAFKNVQNLDEIKIETLGVSSEYEEIFGRIVK